MLNRKQLARRWAFFPKVVELDGVERNLVILGLRLSGANTPASE